MGVSGAAPLMSTFDQAEPHALHQVRAAALARQADRRRAMPSFDNAGRHSRLRNKPPKALNPQQVILAIFKNGIFAMKREAMDLIAA